MRAKNSARGVRGAEVRIELRRAGHADRGRIVAVQADRLLPS